MTQYDHRITIPTDPTSMKLLLHKKLGLVIFMYELIKSIGSGLNPYLALALRLRYGARALNRLFFEDNLLPLFLLFLLLFTHS